MVIACQSIEEAADELARLDSVAGIAAPSFATALRLSAIAELASLDLPTHALPFSSVASAHGDPLHAAALPATALQWRDLIIGEERRIRGGATVTSQRLAVVAPALATYADRARLEAIWREGGTVRAVLDRALDTAAWCPSTALGEATATLLLCAGGRTDRVRLLCFADVPPSPRSDATRAWREGDPDPWRTLGAQALTRRARALRRALTAALHGADDEETRLESLGRAAINARRALVLLRRDLTATVPSLAQALALSRPAAADALDRLTATRLVRELTGRARDRVFAYEAACGVATVTDGLAVA